MQRRRERRYEVWESVVLTVLEKPEPRHRAATVIDISPSGYRVLTGIGLAVGTEVLITLNSVAIVGSVRHCKSAGHGSFAAGVEITEVAGGVAERSSGAELDCGGNPRLAGRYGGDSGLER